MVLVYASQGGRYCAEGCIHSKLDWDCLQSFVTKADQNMAHYSQNGSDMSFVGQEPAQNGQAGCKALEE